jgi:formate-dependent nitrite reductase cytochrome c552 subunit
MCAVSMIGDHYRDKWGKEHPDWFKPSIIPNHPNPFTQFPTAMPSVTKQEFDALKKEVLEMKELLKRAIKYDEDNNEPHCEIDEKVALLKKVAEMVGIDLTDIFTPKATARRVIKAAKPSKRKIVVKP